MKTTRQKILEQQSLNRKIWAKDNGRMRRIDANKLIAEFMGLDIIPLEQFVLGVQSTIDRIKIGRKDYICPMTEGYLLEHLQYHTSWDWLMPVVESCLERLDARDTSADNIKKNMISCDKRGLYNAVVEFINEYNKK